MLATPNEDQQRLLELVWSAHLRADGQWPIYQYVDLTLDGEPHPLNAHAVLLSCPYVFYPPGPGYGWLWLEGDRRFPKADARLGLTVLGKSRVPAAGRDVELFMKALSCMVVAARSVRPSPTQVQPLQLTSTELRLGCLPRASPAEIRAIARTLTHEPATWGTVSESGGLETWTASLDPRIRIYVDVESVEDYADRLLAEIAPPRPEPPPILASSLALPDAIDYLNAVWHLRFDEDLFGVSRCKSAAELSHRVGTRDEFNSRVTALYSILGQTRIPGRKRASKPADLMPTLTRRLSTDGLVRATAAIDLMQAFLKARAIDQHVDAQDEGIVKMAELGLRWPIDDYGLAWQTIQARMVEALNNLRTEIDLLPVPRRGKTP